MTDRPTPNDISPDPDVKGGWHQPRLPGGWKAPEDKPAKPSGGWQVMPALPQDMSAEPELPGAWHLPTPEDTIYTATDELQVKAKEEVDAVAEAPLAVSPEDMIISFSSARLQPPPSEEETAPIPDVMDADFGISELIALTSLEEEKLGAGTGVNIFDEDDSDLNLDDLSESDKALLAAVTSATDNVTEVIPSPTTEASAESAADVARRMAAQLSDGEDEAPSAVAPASAEGESAADVARRMAAQLSDEGGDHTPLPSATGPMEPAQSALAQKFQQTEQQVRALKNLYQSGQITRDDLQAQLRTLMILDENNVWWMMGVETDSWYKFENGNWVVATPPVPTRPPAPRTLTSELDPSQVIAGSLPYLPDAPASPVGNTEYTGYSPESAAYGGTSPSAGINFGPDVRAAERVDPNATVVGNYAFETSIPSSEPTMVSPAVSSEPTIRSPLGGLAGGDVPTPALEPPNYDLSAAESPIYDEFAEQQRSSVMRLVLTAVVALVACGLISGIAAVAGVTLWYNSNVAPWQAQIAALANYEPAFKTARIYDANGGLIAELNSRAGGARTEVPLDRISPYMIHAVISQENERFYDDPGFDPIAIARAFLQNLGSGSIQSGASTITQQIARNLVIRDTEVSADRKVLEILIANEIARQYDKNFILQLYLNEVFFGNQSYGVEAAARFYFDKPASELNLAESALLASIIPAPADNDPVINKDRATRNLRDTVRKMIAVGCLQFQHGNWPQQGPFCVGEGIQIEYEGSRGPMLTVNADGTFGGVLAFQIAEVELTDFRPRASTVRYPHFVNFIQGQIEVMFGTDVMFQRGFNIYTTLIPTLQDTAQDNLARRVAQLRDNGVNTGAVMVTDPRTGAIRAMVGSPDFNNEAIAGQVDNTRTWQQPGSAIKVVTYAASFEGVDGRYLTPSSILWDVPSPYNINGVSYNPVNFDRRYRGPVNVRYALQNSLNVPAVKAYEFIGNQKFIDVAQRMGLQFLPEAQFGLPSGLGANEVRLIDMMKAYGTIANGGVYQPLFAIERITEEVDGQVIDVAMPAREESRQAISPQIAFLMVNILSDDLARADQFGTNGTLTLAQRGIPTQNTVAAKTGTSDNGRDLWTMGFTRNVVVGVWLGTFDNAPTFNTTGFLAASPIWNAVISAATVNQPPPFDNPGGVVLVDVCRDTGALAVEGDGCANRVREFAIQDRLPPQQSFVRNVEIDTWTGLVANEWCPENKVSATFANISDPFAVNWINSTAEGQRWAQRVNLPLPLQAAPTNACQQGMTLPSVRINNPSDNQQLTGTLTITGQVTAPDFNRYELQYAAASAPQNFQPIGTFSTTQFPNAGSTLGTWDTTTVPNGSYILRLRVTSTTGGYINRDVTVNIANVQPTATPTPPVVPTAPLAFPTLPDATLPFDDLNPTPTATLDPSG